MSRYIVLLVLIVLGAPSVSAQGEVIRLHLSVSDGMVESNGVTVTPGYPQTIPEDGGPYLVRVVNETGDTLLSRSLQLEESLTVEGHGIVLRNETEKTVLLPYHQHASRIELYHENRFLLAENITATPSDQADQDTNQTNRSPSERQQLPGVLIGGLLAGILVLGLLLYLSIEPD